MKRRRCPWRPIAPHHIQYENKEKGIPEIVALLYNSEHRALTTVLRLERNPKTRISINFLLEMLRVIERIFAYSAFSRLRSQDEMNLELVENQWKRQERRRKRSRKL